MNVIRQSKFALGVFSGLLGAILAILVGMAATPAQAAESLTTGINRGGLVFTAASQQGVTQTIVSEVENGAVTVYGPADINVTQVTVGQGQTRASGVILGDGTNSYTGTITFQNVNINGSTLTGTTANNPTIYCQTTTVSGAGAPGGATVILQNCQIGTSNSVKAAVQLGNGTAADTLSVQADSRVTGTNVPGVWVEGTGTTAKKPVVVQFANGGGVISGGSNQTSASGTSTTSALFSDTDTYVRLQMSDNGTIVGQVGDLGDKNYGPGAGIITQQGTDLTILGEGTLNVIGGAGADNTNGDSIYDNAGAIGLMMVNEDSKNPTVTIQGPGVVNITGGNGGSVNASSSFAPGYGGVAIATTSSTVPALTVSGGTLNAMGGLGGSTNQNAAAGEGGKGINIGDGTNAASVLINGGNANFIGGNGGRSNQNAPFTFAAGGPAITTTTTDGTPNVSTINIEQASTTSEPPVVTATGGLTDQDYVQAITKNVTIDPNDTVKRNGTWNWIALTRDDNPTDPGELTDIADLAGFAGMKNETADLAANIVGPAYAEITTATISGLNAGVLRNEPTAPNGLVPAQYVVAQTSYTMTGTMPQAQRTYQVSLSATFDINEQINASNFGQLVGFTATKPGVVTPEEDVSSANVTIANSFYVVTTAEGNSLTVELDPQDANISKSINNPTFLKMYPDLTVGSGEIPVVYTVSVTNGTGTNVGTITPSAPEGTTSNFPIYTDAEGNGTLVCLPSTGYDVLNDLLSAGQPVSSIVTATPANVTNPPQFIGLFNETVTPFTQVNNTQVTEWSSNANLTAEWGALTLTGAGPTPTSVAQGDTTEVNATYHVAPLNNKITTYDFDATGITAPWNSIFVNIHEGASPANGLTVEPTDSTVTGENPFIVTVHADVTATDTCDLGSYRVWPTVAQNGDPVGSAPNYNGTGTYIVVSVVAGTGELPGDEINVIRVYNPFSLEHIYTTDPNEVETLVNLGWENEDIAWVAPTSSVTPIYRVYNQYNGDHLYTVSLNEYNTLRGIGWTGEGVKLYSANQSGAQVYRLWNPYMEANAGAYSHLWTGDFNEYETLGGLGWDQEGVAWYALSVPQPE